MEMASPGATAISVFIARWAKEEVLIAQRQCIAFGSVNEWDSSEST